MKKKAIEKLLPPKTRKRGYWNIVQQLGAALIINHYQDGKLVLRYCADTKTGEYAALANGVWRQEKAAGAIGGLHEWEYGWRSNLEGKNKRYRMSEDDELLAKKILKSEASVARALDRWEDVSNMDRRQRAESRRLDRVNEEMAKIPPLPDDLHEWIDAKACGEEYAIRGAEVITCTACGANIRETVQAQKPKDRNQITCPHCGSSLIYLARKRHIKINTHFAVAQSVDDQMSVVRHFNAAIICEGGARKRVAIRETVRFVMYRSHGFRIYYNQYPGGSFFDYKSNPAFQRMRTGFLYETGVRRALSGTAFESWEWIFAQMAEAGVQVNYNALMASTGMEGLVEMLFKGRFYRLLEETAQDISVWDGRYYGPLDKAGKTIEQVFKINDRQMINRLRALNGGEDMMRWLRYADETKAKFPDEVLCWLEENHLELSEMREILKHMSPRKAMNYITRQQKESYKGRSAGGIAQQYEDYMKMCRKLHKNTDDEMVYRPRELKRRHDECVEEINRRRDELDAEKYSEKFSEAENVLQEIRTKYEYADENYVVTVPQRIVDIVKEGRALHHCVGSTDRYFDRIKQHETYICFLRKASAPEEPYYTVEIEPGGTVRQHRGLYDEEPEIDEVKPFIQKWQKEIRRRMSKEDHKRAAVSREKRIANIEELRQKNNTRVLQGLMEDFMEAM